MSLSQISILSSRDDHNMAEGTISEGCFVDSTVNLPTNGKNDENKPGLPLLIEKKNNKTKIKWSGDLDSLKSFVECKLILTANWSYATTNSGFHVFKATVAKLCFYPGTKTLTVQGTEQEDIRNAIYAFYSMEMDEKTSDYVLTEDGHIELTYDDYNIDGSEVPIERFEILDPETQVVNKNQSCSGCEENSKLISELWLKTTALENQFHSCNSNRPAECRSCDEMRAALNYSRKINNQFRTFQLMSMARPILQILTKWIILTNLLAKAYESK